MERIAETEDIPRMIQTLQAMSKSLTEIEQALRAENVSEKDVWNGADFVKGFVGRDLRDALLHILGATNHLIVACEGQEAIERGEHIYRPSVRCGGDPGNG